jgi:alpha-amylase/alpha-mannosidase (GH57 family)
VKPIHLAFLWHQHQPFYRDQRTGEFAMPWVRLHAVKDYLGMAQLLEEVPQMRATVNLVPSLVTQIEAYLEGAEDVALRLTRKPAADLTESEQEYLLDHFFSAHREILIHPFPRYRELVLRRQFGRHSAAEVRRHFQERDLRDLQVWFNLAWMGPLHLEKEPEIAALVRKGAGFSEEDKVAILEIQRRAMAEVIPAHRRLQERGQIELTTTPFFHPILPLLLDPASAGEAMPGAPLPNGAMPLVEDAREQLRLAREAHARWFGRPPRGLWPSEGSVSQALVPIVLDLGFEWMATDEEVLFRSIGRGGRATATAGSESSSGTTRSRTSSASRPTACRTPRRSRPSSAGSIASPSRMRRAARTARCS